MAVKAKSQRVSKKQETLADEPLVQNKIALDELIPVMSLINYTLNLSTLKGGQGKQYKFETFGQTKQIIYQDLLDVMEHYASFMRDGLFVILDKRVINRHGLQEIVSKVLTREKILQIVDGSKDALPLFKSCMPEQQRIIIGMLVDKLTKDPDSVDLNVVDQISRYSKVNILQKAEDSRSYLEDRRKMEAEAA